jgi:hypothetical protein
MLQREGEKEVPAAECELFMFLKQKVLNPDNYNFKTYARIIELLHYPIICFLIKKI